MYLNLNYKAVKTFKKNGIIHRTCYNFTKPYGGKCTFELQIKGKGWKTVAKGNYIHYDKVIHLLKTKDFNTHEEASEMLRKEKFFN